MPLHIGKKNYEDFDNAVRAVMRHKKFNKERAERYVGSIYWKQEGHKKDNFGIDYHKMFKRKY